MVAGPASSASVDGDELLWLAGLLLDSRMHLGTLPVLLERQPARDALAQAAAATHLGRDGNRADAVVAEAAAAGAPLLDSVLAAGGGVSLSALYLVLQQAEEGSPAVLRLLLSRGVPAVPGDGEPAQLETCPLYVMLESFRNKQLGVRGGFTPSHPDAFMQSEPACLCVCR